LDTSLRILHLEDNPLDADLIHATLEEEGIHCQAVRVDTKSEFVKAIDQGGFELIFADYSLPSFDGISALGIAKEKCPDIPFLFVSATLGEDLAVETLKQGAIDYVLKQRLSRLAPSVHRALREVKERVERMRAEAALKEREHQMRQSQKMEVLGRLAGGIAHDFNNLLTIIMGYSQVLLNELGPTHPLAGQVQETQKAGNQAALLVRQLLGFSRRQVSNPKIVDLHGIVEHMEEMLRRLIGEHITLMTMKNPHPGRTKADQGHLEQVLLNLVVNARDAMPQGGTLTVETVNIDVPTSSDTIPNTMDPGPYVLLKVSDTGCGMDAQTQEKIFEPFFTTKEEGKGTGLGLSTVHGIVKQVGGWIDVESQIGKGTTFLVYFPRTDAPLSPADQKVETGKSVRGTEKILIVEDEPAVRQLIRNELRRFGYTVLEAKNGTEAFLISTQHDDTIDLLLTDVVMPGMNGREVAQQLTAIRPNLKVLYLSGYTEDIGVLQGLQPGKAAFLEKPFTPEALAVKVREILDG